MSYFFLSGEVLPFRKETVLENVHLNLPEYSTRKVPCGIVDFWKYFSFGFIGLVGIGDLADHQEKTNSFTS